MVLTGLVLTAQSAFACFIVVIVLVFASTKVIKIAKDEIKGLLQVEFGPKTAEQEEEEKRKAEE